MNYDILQVGIPADAEKINTKTTEEVSLPPSASHKPIVAEKILISQLDNVAKLVFATTKRLNEVYIFCVLCVISVPWYIILHLSINSCTAL